MSIQKREYELSVWQEALAAEGQRVKEKKHFIIGAHDMEYLGRARNPKFITKLNGTHTLTFEMPDKYFDSAVGDYVHNEFVDALFSECKIKFYYKKKWYEFNIKNVSDTKHYKSYMRTYTCQDAYIDELARNGYGITFDEELYNNVDEVGVFSEEILEDSVWEYDAHLNWGDFTEYIEEKLFKVPLSLFGDTLRAHKVNYQLENSYNILNIFTNEKRKAEMGDDLAREKHQFWDSYDNKNPLLKNSVEITNEKNKYIYVPYSQLNFCYVSSDTSGENGLEEAFAATEYPATYGDMDSYAIAPSSIDPTALIQFLYIPEDEEIEVDEAGLIVNKNYTYVMTIDEWNKQIVNSRWFYKFEDYKEDGFKKKVLVDSWNESDFIYGNRAAYYDGYLNEIKGSDALTIEGKKIGISDRTEINISEDIDQYVKVYNNKATEYTGLYTSEDWTFDPETDSEYRVCSKTETRQIVPQLARNLLQNSSKISSITGWEVMESYLTSQKCAAARVEFSCIEVPRTVEVPNEDYSIEINEVAESFLVFLPAYQKIGEEQYQPEEQDEKNAIVNFGIIGQEKTIEKGRTYALGINIREISEDTETKFEYQLGIPKDLSNIFIRIGSGSLVKDGDYKFDEDSYIDIPIEKFYKDGYNSYILFRTKETFTNPYFAIYSQAPYELVEVKLFEAYTKGIDQFTDGYFKYSGRDLFSSYSNQEEEKYFYSAPYTEEELRRQILFEDNIMPGDTYGYTRYFIQQLKLEDSAYDTFGAKKYLDENAPLDAQSLPLSSSKYTEDDYKIITNYIDLNNCEFYNSAAEADSFDCKCNSEEFDKVCLYQKYGYCPYRFQTEKHCRRIRTLKGEKSNRFNLTQEIGKVFEVYPMYYVSHTNTGKVMSQSQAAEQGTRNITPGREDWMDKRLFYITEKGKENKLGFRYEKNLSNISRTIASDKIVSKLYVLDVDSQISDTGLCSIKLAEDNPSKDNFIIDFSYYIAQGLLDEAQTNADLYGINDKDIGYLKTLGYFNTQYDAISNKIINLTAASFTELKANLDVNLAGIEAAQKRLRQLEKIMSKYTVKNTESDEKSYIENNAFKSYQAEYIEQNAIYIQLIEDTFYTNGECVYSDTAPANFFDDDKECQSIEDVKKKWLDTHSYTFGILGQYNKEYLQIKEWTKEQASYLRRINELSQSFYRKYEPFLKEGTWSDSNYVSDNAYYYGAIDVAKEGAIPKVNYSINVVDIEPLYREGDYDFEIADTSYIEDIGMFGINQHTGLPNRLKVLISQLDEYPESEKDNKINVQNFTTQFEDLFQQVSASVQSLTFNENIYKRSSNFTSLQTIAKDSLQGALSQNNLTLLKTPENNIELDATGQSGSDINNHNNKYMLNGQGLFFSNNGGQSWTTSVGPNGINADLIKTGTLDASKIKIVDGQYIYFSWDKNGITAYRDPKTVSSAESFNDYVQFNKFGLSLVEKGQIKLRAGYSFTGDNGKADEEKTIGNNIGFYLYNSEGKPIFSTESGSDNSDASQVKKETARINLTGEMRISDSSTITIYSGYDYSQKYRAENVNCYPLGNDENILTVNSFEGIQISGTEATYTVSIGAISEIEYAAAIAYYYASYNLTKIIINSTEFTQLGITDNGNYWGSIYHGNELRYCQFNKKTFGTDNFNFIIIEGNIFKKYENVSPETKILLSYESGSMRSETQFESQQIEGINKGSTSTQPYVYHTILSFTNAYKDPSSNVYYTIENSNTGQTSNGTVALYLNNRTDLDIQNPEEKKDSRMFVCCSFLNQQTNNILSILKNGNLYMGGTIKQLDNSPIAEETKMSDKIKIDSPYLSIEGDRLKMSFDRIIDMNTGTSIENYVSNRLNQSTTSIIDTLSGRTHYHYIDYQNIEWQGDSSWLSKEIYSDGDITITIGDIIDNIRWGNAYTELSQI